MKLLEFARPGDWAALNRIAVGTHWWKMCNNQLPAPAARVWPPY